MRPAKRVEFGGKMCTIAQIVRVTGLTHHGVHARIRRGQDLSAPKQNQRAGKEDAMCDSNVRYARDIECRVARLVCGGTCTQDEIAALWDVSHQRIDQLEKKAFAKLRALAGISNEVREALRELDRMRAERAGSKRVYRSKIRIRRSV